MPFTTMTSPPVASKPAQACLLLVDTPRPPQEAASPEPDNIAHLYQLCKGNSIKVMHTSTPAVAEGHGPSLGIKAGLSKQDTAVMDDSLMRELRRASIKHVIMAGCLSAVSMEAAVAAASSQAVFLTIMKDCCGNGGLGSNEALQSVDAYYRSMTLEQLERELAELEASGNTEVAAIGRTVKDLHSYWDANEGRCCEADREPAAAAAPSPNYFGSADWSEGPCCGRL